MHKQSLMQLFGRMLLAVFCFLTFKPVAAPLDAATLTTKIATLKTIAYKYVISPSDATKFASAYEAVHAQLDSLSADQIKDYTDAILMARYGMVFERDAEVGKATLTDKTKLFAAITAEADILGGTINFASINSAKPLATSTDFATWLTYLQKVVSAYRILLQQTDAASVIAEDIGNGSLISLHDVVNKIRWLVSNRMAASLAQLKTTDQISLSSYIGVADQDDYNNFQATATTDTDKAFIAAMEDPTKSWTDLRTLITNTKDALTKWTNADAADTAAMDTLLTNLSKPIEVQERIKALQLLVSNLETLPTVTAANAAEIAAKKELRIKEFEVRFSKLLNTAAALQTADRAAITTVINSFVGKSLNPDFGYYTRLLTNGVIPTIIFGADTNKKFALLWNEQDGTLPATKFCKKVGSDLQIVDDNPFDANAYFKFTVDGAKVSMATAGTPAASVDSDGKLGSTVGNFYVFGSKESLSLKSDNAQKGFLTVQPNKKLNTITDGRPAGTEIDLGGAQPGLQPNVWGTFKLVPIPGWYNDVAAIHESWAAATPTKSVTTLDDAAKSNARDILTGYLTTIVSAVGQETMNGTVLNNLIVELTAFIKAMFQDKLENWQWFNQVKTIGGVSINLNQQINEIILRIRVIFQDTLAKNALAEQALTNLTTLVVSGPASAAADLAISDSLEANIQVLMTKLQQCEGMTQDALRSSINSKAIKSLFGTDSFYSDITKLIARRMESDLKYLKTSDGSSIARYADSSSATKAWGLQTSKNAAGVVTKFISDALEDPSQSWKQYRDVITKFQSVVNNNKALLTQQELTALIPAVSKLTGDLNKAIEPADRITALQKLVATNMITATAALTSADDGGADCGGLTATEHFEVRLYKLINACAAQIDATRQTNERKIIDDFLAVNPDLKKEVFKPYKDLIDQGYTPSALFPTLADGEDNTVAFVWQEQDGSLPAEKYWTVDPNNALKINTDAQQNVFDFNNRFKIHVTSDAKVVIYREVGSEKYLLKNDGSLAIGSLDAATDDNKFQIFGSLSAMSLKSASTGKFLALKINGGFAADQAAAGKRATFRVIKFQQLHSDLSVVHDSWKGTTTTRNWKTAEPQTSDFQTAITGYTDITFTTEQQADPAVALLVLGELQTFLDVMFDGKLSRWQKFTADGMNSLMRNLSNQIKQTFKDLSNKNKLVKDAFTALDNTINHGPSQALQDQQISNSMEVQVQYWVTELKRYESLRSDAISSSVSDGSLKPLFGTNSVFEGIKQLIERRMESGLVNLKTKNGSEEAKDLTYFEGAASALCAWPLQTAKTTKFINALLEDLANSWPQLSALIEEFKTVLNTSKIRTDVLTADQLKNVISSIKTLTDALHKPIEIAERINALKALVDRDLIKELKDGDAVKLTAPEQFEIRLAKLINVPVPLSKDEQRTITQIITDFHAMQTQLPDDAFEEYLAFLTQGVHPGVLFPSVEGQVDNFVALAWQEQDETLPETKFVQYTASKPLALDVSETQRMLDPAHIIKIHVTNDAKVVFYVPGASANTTLLLKNDGTWEAKALTAAGDMHKFQVLGSPSAMSFKSIQEKTNGFLLISADKKLITQTADGKPAGITNAAGDLQPGTRGIFKVTVLSALQQNLAQIRAGWLNKNWATTAPTKEDTQSYINNYSDLVMNLMQAEQAAADNATLMIGEIHSFFDAVFNNNDIKRWEVFSENTLKALNLLTQIKIKFKDIITANTTLKTEVDLIENTINKGPQDTQAQLATGNYFALQVQMLSAELSRYQSLTKDKVRQQMEQGNLMPLIASGNGTKNALQEINNLIDRRMEADLADLQTGDGVDLTATSADAATDKIQLKSSSKYVSNALESPAKSWQSLRSLVDKFKQVAYTDKAWLSIDQQRNLNNTFYELGQRFLTPITIQERIVALQKLVENNLVVDIKDGATVKLTVGEHFEIRLIKLLNSLSSQITDAEKTTVLSTVERFVATQKLDTNIFADYVRILRQGYHPSELFKSDHDIAFIWHEQDGSLPENKFLKVDADATKMVVNTSDKQSLLEPVHIFKVRVTNDAKVVIYKEVDDKKYLLKNDGSLSVEVKTGKTQNTLEKPLTECQFYVYGSPDALSFKSVQESTNGFLTVTYDKALATKLGGKPAGKLNTNDILEPGSWGILKAIEITPLHNELAKIRAMWTGKSWNPKNTKTFDPLTIFTELETLVVTMDNSAQDTDFNVDLIFGEFIAFLDAIFRGSVKDWGNFVASDYQESARKLIEKMKLAFNEALGANGAAKKKLDALVAAVNNPPEILLEPHEAAPANGQTVALSVVKNGIEYYLRTESVQDAKGDHLYLKIDENADTLSNDPVDTRCHLQVLARGNKLGFAAKASDGSTKSLQLILPDPNDAALRVLWQDPIGQNSIKRMTRFEFLPLGAGDFNATSRRAEQFEMEYKDTANKTWESGFALTSQATQAGMFSVDNDSNDVNYDFAVGSGVDVANKQFTTATTADGVTAIKILPISSFIVDLGKVRLQADPLAAMQAFIDKINLAVSVQDLGFLVDEARRYIEQLQKQRGKWLQAVTSNKLIDLVNDFMSKCAQRAGSVAELTVKIVDFKKSYAQTPGDSDKSTVVVRWLNNDPQPLYLASYPAADTAVADAKDLVFTATTFYDKECHFGLKLSGKVDDPLAFALNLTQPS